MESLKAFKSPARRSYQWLRRHVVDPVSKTFTLFGLDDGYLLAAGVAYYVGLSIFPLLMVLTSVLGWFLRFTAPGQDARQRVLQVVQQNFSEETATQVASVFQELGRNSGTGTLVGTAILVFAAGTIFAQFERAFDRIWRYTAPEDLGWIATFKSLLIDRLTAFLLMIGVAALVALTFVAAIVLQTVQRFADAFLPLPSGVWTLFQILATVAINTAAFGVLYHTMPRARVKWNEAFRGGLVIAIVWEVGRRVLTEYLIGGRYTAYGVVGALIAIQIWAYYGVTVILLGAEYVRVTCKHCGGPASAELSRRRFWQLMSKAVARRSAGKPDVSSPVTPPVTPPVAVPLPPKSRDADGGPPLVPAAAKDR